jgi:hypothetical protein
MGRTMRLSRQAWSSAVAEGRAGCRAGRMLLREGLIGQNELASRVAATVADAAAELLISGGPESGESALRMITGERHWLGEFGPRQLPRRRAVTMTHSRCDSSAQGRRRMAHGDGAGAGDPGRRRSEEAHKG